MMKYLQFFTIAIGCLLTAPALADCVGAGCDLGGGGGQTFFCEDLAEHDYSAADVKNCLQLMTTKPNLYVQEAHIKQEFLPNCWQTQRRARSIAQAACFAESVANGRPTGDCREMATFVTWDNTHYYPHRSIYGASGCYAKSVFYTPAKSE